MPDEKRDIATKMIETRLEQYDTFYDHAWAGETLKRIPTQLREAFNNLCLGWKEAANVHRLPWLMMYQMRQFAVGLLNEHTPHLVRLVEGVKRMIMADLDGILQRSDKKKVLACIKKMDQKVRISDKLPQIEFPVNEYWEKVNGDRELELSISGSQNLSYCAVFFAYEWFLVSCFRVLGGDEERRPSEQKFWIEFKNRLGSDVNATHWEDCPVKIAREARHSIAHQGAKAKSELIDLNSGIFISDDGMISVRPVDNRGLFETLKQKVTQLVAEATPKLAKAA